jgi:regulator of sirC expression with transglutaminase-like and TPR domain
MIHQAGSVELIEAIFALESTVFAPEKITESRRILDQLISMLEPRLISCDTPLQQAGQFKRVIFGDFGFWTRAEAAEKNFTLTSTLFHRGGTCIGLTTVYVCIAEALGLPFRPRLFEDHIAVGHRVASPPMHIETTRRGNFLTPNVSLSWYGPPIGTRDGLLTNEQFLAVHLSSYSAFVLAEEGRLKDALFMLDRAIELFPQYTAAWVNRAVISMKLGDAKIAEKSLKHVLSLEPGPHYQKVVRSLMEHLH